MRALRNWSCSTLATVMLFLVMAFTCAPDVLAQSTLNILNTSLPTGAVGTAYLTGMSATGGAAPYTWSASGLPPGLALAATGQISGTPTKAGDFRVTMTVKDGSLFIQKTGSKTFTLTIFEALSITTSSLPPGPVGVAYSENLVATGGKGPYFWSVFSGRLPDGINMSSAGVISGTPTTLETSNFTVRVSDTSSQTTTKALSITVNPALSITTSTPLPSGTVNVSYSQTLAATNGTSPYTWSVTSGNLPTGLTLSSSGSITGTPSTAGSEDFTVRVTDSASRTATKAFSININPPALSIITGSPLPAGAVGESYSQTFAANGGTPPYSWSVTSGSLASGLILSSSGVIGGTPATAGTSNFTVEVADSASRTAAKSFALTIDPPALSITTPSALPAGTVGESYSQALGATGGTPSYSWSVTSGSLASGLILSSSGVISGTPATAGTSNFTVRVADSRSQTASRAFAITINPATLLITTTSPLPAGTVGASYAQSFSATGGTPPYTWAFTTGTLPPGLNLSQGGALSGTPANAGTFSFAVRVRDTTGATNSNTFSLTVQTTLTIATASPLPTAVANSFYSLQLEAATSDPLTWSVISGNLPAGVTLSSNGLLSGTPTRTGVFTFTVEASNAANQRATKSLTISINDSTIASFSLTNVPGTIDPAQQVIIGMSISTPQSNVITGSLTISFTSNSVIPGNDPFVLFSNGSRTADFTIPANSTAAVFAPAVSLLAGTVAGVVSFRADIRSGPTGLLVGSVTIRPTVPKLVTTTATRTSGGIRIQVTGFSPDRTVTNAQFAFAVKTSAGIQRVDLNRSVQSEFDTWFRSAASASFGSSFVFEQIFTVQGDAAMIDTVTVGLTNGQGSGSSTAVKVNAN